MSAALPELILIAAICFNAVLSVINGHVVALARVHVVIAEILVYAGALAVIVFRADRRMWPWFMLTLFIISMGLLVSLGSGGFNAKYIRDVLVIPVFIMLGMTYQRATFVRPLTIIQTVVFLVAVLEVASPDTFAELFKILDYYVNTRDFAANSFWNTESTLFVSATRPGARFFGFVDWHRVSSIFLEPVSLGNYCVVAAMLILACWNETGRAMRAYLVATTLFLLVACDGRLAAVSIFMIVLIRLFFHQLSSRWALIYLPAILLLSALYVWAFNVSDTSDNFTGRVAGSMATLALIDLPGLLGLSASSAESAQDSGIAYFVLSQSLLGVVVIWLSICLFPRGNSPASRVYVHAVALFISLNLLISYSFFSIKVASLIWFFYGYLYARDLAADDVTEAVAAPAERKLMPFLAGPAA